MQRNGGYAKAKSNVATASSFLHESEAQRRSRESAAAASSFLYESEVQRSGSVQP
ncbi:hypothetical protein [Lysinibacillus sp. fls2-241-R2A-57]|uniref:hypothetical protein n=1 Tax=Lysinibacillus sp. fls2-241-R2A-57 TaxID=3040292 RepID=UPI0025569CB8|nr:hypothetical protein [Lysinibacillus sp. fls2-241-R2A-57]